MAERVYGEAVRAEEAVRRGGGSRRDAAEVGAKVIEEELLGCGYASYEAFMVEAAAAEVGARGAGAVREHARPGARGAIGEVLAGTEELQGVLGELVGRLEVYQRVCSELTGASEEVLEVARRLEGAVLAAQEASEVAVDAPVLANVARVMARPIGEAVAALEKLGPELTLLRGDVARLRFWIALARVQAEMSAAFAAEAHDGLGEGATLASVPLLCDAAAAGALEMARRVRRVNEGLHGVAELAGQAEGMMEDFRRWLGQWRNLVLRHRAGSVIGGHLAVIDGELAASWDWMRMLRWEGYEAAVVPFDTALMTAPLERIARAL
ncbi:histidine kinase [Actinocorallia sp. A-T 12471]|uniref:histidine kinase n=1 Tax=Actinocorallia sp. A-T 12471 TaxID=3089813 RepID=UPI0029D0ECC2|nr:histidine kinase [Actinocorallia sp. A-T 12471]MDX6738156.1 histidine kinase [Actinocorallia sp. A-T 12471]